MDPEAALERQCYGGETLLEAASVRGGAIGVSSHRLLVVTPDGPGARFRAVDRPNVTDVTAETSGPTAHRDRAVTTGVVAVVLLVAGTLVDLGGLVQPVEAPAGAGIGGLLGLVDALVAALGLVDEALLLGGLVALAVALGSAAWYLRGRDRVIEVAVAGGDPVRVPITRADAGVADRLRAALRADGPLDPPHRNG